MRYLLCACALALAARPATGQQVVTPHGTSDSLYVTRREAVTRALTANPQLDIADAQTAQARARRTQAVAIPDPQFGVSFEQARGVFGGGGPNAKVVGATLTIPFPDKFRLLGRQGTADVRSAEFDATRVRQLVAAQTSQAYDTLLGAARRRRDLLETQALSQDFVKKTEARFNAGTAPKLDLIRARVDLAQAETQLIANERDLANARASLNRLLGRPLDAPLAAADTLVVPRPPPELAQLESAALANRPELAGLRQQQVGAQAAIGLAREYWFPDLIVGISRDYADPGPGVITTGVALPLPLFFWQHSHGEIAETRARARELTATYRDAEAAIGQDVRAAYATAAAAVRQAVFLRDELLPSAREAFRIASASYGLGGSSALDVLDARRTLLDAQSQYTDALTAANTARADLERAVGGPLDPLDTGETRGP